MCEIGCGPGQVARYLRDRDVSISGIDLSEEMVKCAQRNNPDLSFKKGNMLALDLPTASLAGIVFAAAHCGKALPYPASFLCLRLRRR